MVLLVNGLLAGWFRAHPFVAKRATPAGGCALPKRCRDNQFSGLGRTEPRRYGLTEQVGGMIAP